MNRPTLYIVRWRTDQGYGRAATVPLFEEGPHLWSDTAVVTLIGVFVLPQPLNRGIGLGGKHPEVVNRSGRYHSPLRRDEPKPLPKPASVDDEPVIAWLYWMVQRNPCCDNESELKKQLWPPTF